MGSKRKILIFRTSKLCLSAQFETTNALYKLHSNLTNPISSYALFFSPKSQIDQTKKTIKQKIGKKQQLLQTRLKKFTDLIYVRTTFDNAWMYEFMIIEIFRDEGKGFKTNDQFRRYV